MLGGGAAVGLPASSHKQHFHRPSTPTTGIDLAAWRDSFLHANNNKNDDTASDNVETGSDAGGCNNNTAINLSSSSRPSSAPTTAAAVAANQRHVQVNGTEDMELDVREEQGLKLGSNGLLCRLRRNSLGGGLTEEEPPRPPTSGKMSPNSPMSLFPPGLQQMHQLLQSQLAAAGPGFGPAQLQHFMQQQSLQHQQQLAESGRKQLEQLMHQLQEQLQINLLQQTHMMQAAAAAAASNGGGGGDGDKAKISSASSSAALQQLQIQQQQLISQLQLVQQRLLMLPSFHPRKHQHHHHHHEDFNERNWKENGNRTPSPRPNANKNGHPAKFGKDRNDIQLDKHPEKHPLYSHGSCKWTGCETQCPDLSSFLKHISSEHVLDDKSTAQARVQMQIVSQLELQLQKERERLQAMMAHLHLSKEADMKNGPAAAAPAFGGKHLNHHHHPDGPPTLLQNDMPKTPPKMAKHPLPPPGALSFHNFAAAHNLPNPLGLHPTPLSALTAAARSPTSMQQQQQPVGGPIRRRVSDKVPLPLTNGLPYMMDRAGLDIAQEIYRNREFYRTQDVRPPFTYASLIRQAVVEAPDRQLTLHEIYNWFTNTFAYFRRNAASWKAIIKSPNNQLTLSEIYNWFQTTFAHFRCNNASWKNAIRTNLSLHKCFVRYEDDFGSFWMVDDNEFLKRRHLSRGRPRKYEPNQQQQTAAAAAAAAAASKLLPPPPATPGAASGEGEQGRSRQGSPNGQSSQVKSPSFLHSPSLYSEALNASLQSALGFGEGHLPFLTQLHQQQKEAAEKQFGPQGERNSPSSADLARHFRNSGSFLSSLAAKLPPTPPPLPLPPPPPTSEAFRPMSREEEMIKDEDDMDDHGGRITEDEEEEECRNRQEQQQQQQQQQPSDDWDYNGNSGRECIKEEASAAAAAAAFAAKDTEKEIKREKFEH